MRADGFVYSQLDSLDFLKCEGLSTLRDAFKAKFEERHAVQMGLEAA